MTIDGVRVVAGTTRAASGVGLWRSAGYCDLDIGRLVRGTTTGLPCLGTRKHSAFARNSSTAAVRPWDTRHHPKTEERLRLVDQDNTVLRLRGVSFVGHNMAVMKLAVRLRMRLKDLDCQGTSKLVNSIAVVGSFLS